MCPVPPNWVPAHPQYFILLLIIFLLEIIAGILAYIYYQQVRSLDRQDHGGTDMCRHTDMIPHAPELTTGPGGPGGGGCVPVGRADSREAQPACQCPNCPARGSGGEEGVPGIWISLPVPSPLHGHLVILPAQPTPSQASSLPEPLPPSSAPASTCPTYLEGS